MVEETMRCGRRDENSGVDRMLPGPDEWREMPDGSRTCSYCGSLHPEDFEDILEHYANGDEGYHFDLTTKNYKRYANRPGVKNAAQGGIKFYTPHLVHAPGSPEDQKLQATYKRAVERYREQMEARTAAEILNGPDSRGSENFERARLPR